MWMSRCLCKSVSFWSDTGPSASKQPKAFFKLTERKVKLISVICSFTSYFNIWAPPGSALSDRNSICPVCSMCSLGCHCRERTVFKKGFCSEFLWFVQYVSLAFWNLFKDMHYYVLLSRQASSETHFTLKVRGSDAVMPVSNKNCYSASDSSRKIKLFHPLLLIIVTESVTEAMEHLPSLHLQFFLVYIYWAWSLTILKIRTENLSSILLYN